MSTHCPYCSFQCGVRLTRAAGASAFGVVGDRASPVSRGALCVKGHHAAATLAHPERVTTPLVRDASGALVPASWDDAIAMVTRALAATRALHGADAVGVFGSGALTNEKAYLLGKLARVALGTSNIDYNGRFCMSSAATAANMAFGLDRGLPFPVEDIAHAEVVLVVGGNLAETMPPIMQYFERQRAAGGSLIVVDPRRTPTADASTLHLRLTPGTDAALANGILHVLVRDGLVDERYVDARTEGFEAVKALASSYWPERVERITGVAEARVVEAAHLLGRAKSAIVLTGRGPEQQSQGVTNTLAFINVAPPVLSIIASTLLAEPDSRFSLVYANQKGQILDLAPYRDAYARIADLVRTIREMGHRVETVDCGGGLARSKPSAGWRTSPDCAEYSNNTMSPTCAVRSTGVQLRRC